MVEMVCEYCHEPFQGRRNRKCCSVRCRRILENKRRFWDSRFRYVRFCQTQADWDTLTPEQRAHWKKEGHEAREKLLRIYGNRP